MEIIVVIEVAAAEITVVIVNKGGGDSCYSCSFVHSSIVNYIVLL